jgi:Kef-type K+ transport system membrane component KefB
MELPREPLIILLVGFLLLLAIFIKSRLLRLGVPALLGFLLLGLGLRALEQSFAFLGEQGMELFALLSKIGVICLLFRIGLHADLKSLLKQIRSALMIWPCDVAVSGSVGFLFCYLILGAGAAASLFAAVAATATSVGVSISVWEDAGAMETENGELMLDVAELDDISAIVLMALLFGLAPVLQAGAAIPVGRVLGSFGFVAAKLVAYGGACFLFSRFVEKNYTAFFQRMEKGPEPMITIAATAFIIAALAALLGFSVAMGAFFAGLMFSRDPKAVRISTSFDAIYELFVPFFFIGIGLSVNLSVAIKALYAGLILSGAAVLGKALGIGIPTRMLRGTKDAGLIAVSMVPRAEIALIVIQKGHSLGMVPDHIYGGMVVVILFTCTIIPLLLRRLLARWQQPRNS